MGALSQLDYSIGRRAQLSQAPVLQRIMAVTSKFPEALAGASLRQPDLTTALLPNVGLYAVRLARLPQYCPST